MKMNWSRAIHYLTEQGKPYVLITLVGASGSTPRNSGTKMVVCGESLYDTIGGGHLEHKAMKYAHKLLAEGKDCQHIEHFQLATNLGQCCGGTATVLFECFAATGFNIMVFGAGHVGQALIPILAGLPCHITWVDSRENQFPQNLNLPNVSQVVSESPWQEVQLMPENSLYIVLTHNHQMDFDIGLAVLKREDFAYLGVIASDTKKRRFMQRYQHREVSQSLLERMSCPIGLGNVQGKLPMEVAVSIAGEVINVYQTLQPQQKSEKGTQQGVPWKQLKQLINEDFDVG